MFVHNMPKLFVFVFINDLKFSLLANYHYQSFHHRYDLNLYFGNFCEYLRNVVDIGNLNLTFVQCVFYIFACNIFQTIM